MANKVILVGNAGRDPEIKSLPSGTRIATFSLATNERRKDQDGNWTEHTEWHNLVVWDRLVDVVERFVTKGKQLYIEGRIRTRTYETDGQKKYFTEIHVRELELLGRADGGGDSRRPQDDYGSQSPGGGFPDDADDVPF